MKNRLFLALLVCCSIFTFGTRASDGATNRVPPPPEVLSQKVVTPDGVSIGIAEKNVALPQVFPSTVFSFSLNKKSIDDTAKNSAMTPTRTATGPGTGPNTAPNFGVGGYYQNVLAATGAQHWFYTQADRDGQMTVHLDVPATTAVDYDLYIYRYEPSTGNLYGFKSSTRYPGAAEHISFSTATGSYYFIHVQSYQGGGSEMYYCLHVEMAALGVGEIDDFPDNARTLTPPLNNINTANSGLSMRTDEDFFRFTAPGNGSVITFVPDNLNTVVDLYRQSGTALDYIGLLPGRGAYPFSTATGTTYYLRVRHANNKILNASNNYTLSMTAFNCSGSLTDAIFLGSNLSGSKVIYIASKNLYINSEFIMDVSLGLESLCRYHFEEPDTNPRQAKHDSYAVSPVLAVRLISYTVNGGGSGVSSMPNALAIYIMRDPDNGYLGVRYTNGKYSYQNPNTGEVLQYPSWFTQMGYDDDKKKGPCAFILDLSDKRVKDYASPVGNGFYNRFFDTHSFVITIQE